MHEHIAESGFLQAQAAVAKLSLNDKVNLATGVGWEKGQIACVIALGHRSTY
jgi:hypothetical protein